MVGSIHVFIEAAHTGHSVPPDFLTMETESLFLSLMPCTVVDTSLLSMKKAKNKNSTHLEAWPHEQQRAGIG